MAASAGGSGSLILSPPNHQRHALDLGAPRTPAITWAFKSNTHTKSDVSAARSR
jgi:hypothetical protein